MKNISESFNSLCVGGSQTFQKTFKLHFIILPKTFLLPPKVHFFKVIKMVHAASLHFFFSFFLRKRREIKFSSSIYFILWREKKAKNIFPSSRLNVFIITKLFDRKHTEKEREREREKAQKRGKQRKSIFISLHNNLMIYFFIDISRLWRMNEWKRRKETRQ
jgi:hypothetical protein